MIQKTTDETVPCVKHVGASGVRAVWPDAIVFTSEGMARHPFTLCETAGCILCGVTVRRNNECSIEAGLKPEGGLGYRFVDGSNKEPKVEYPSPKDP